MSVHINNNYGPIFDFSNSTFSKEEKKNDCREEEPTRDDSDDVKFEELSSLTAPAATPESSPKRKPVDPKIKYNLTLTPQQWIERYRNTVEFNFAQGVNATEVIERFREQWKTEKAELQHSTINWRTPLLRSMFFGENKCGWIKNKTQMSLEAFVELVQDAEIKKATFSGAKNASNNG